jgi:rubrerythrin
MTRTIDDLIATFFDELQTSQRYALFAKRVEEEGYLQVAKFFRALSASERVRQTQYRTGIAHHAMEEADLYICPGCGLVFLHDAPEKCPVDETPGAQFERIS